MIYISHYSLQTFIAPEDAAGARDPQKHVRIDPDIERVRQ